jgi:hypothetical protein
MKGLFNLMVVQDRSGGKFNVVDIPIQVVAALSKNAAAGIR